APGPPGAGARRGGRASVAGETYVAFGGGARLGNTLWRRVSAHRDIEVERDNATASEAKRPRPPAFPARRAVRQRASRLRVPSGRSGERSSLMHVGRRGDSARPPPVLLAGAGAKRGVGPRQRPAPQG